jgi:hypothetical protein
VGALFIIRNGIDLESILLKFHNALSPISKTALLSNSPTNAEVQTDRPTG